MPPLWGTAAYPMVCVAAACGAGTACGATIAAVTEATVTEATVSRYGGPAVLIAGWACLTVSDAAAAGLLVLMHQLFHSTAAWAQLLWVPLLAAAGLLVLVLLGVT